MKNVSFLFFVSFCCGIIVSVLWTGSVYASPVTPVKGDPGCQKNLEQCTADLGTCNTDLGVCTAALAACEAAAQVFPGDGYTDPSFGTIGHGPALSYMDNGDGTFTDNNTGYMWEIKTDDGSVHDVDNNTYTWSVTSPNPDGTLFTVFLDTLNNTCQNDESIDCSTNGDADCTGVGGVCGFASYRDWCIPNVKKLQSIVDYSTSNPASSVPGETATSLYWSATTDDIVNGSAWFVVFDFGNVNSGGKTNGIRARAVRPCP